MVELRGKSRSMKFDLIGILSCSQPTHANKLKKKSTDIGRMGRSLGFRNRKWMGAETR